VKPAEINIKDYHYHLPDAKIASFPLDKRDESKLLVYKNGILNESIFNQLHTHLPAHSLLVFNNTKVIHARLFFQRETGAQIEVFCIEPLDHLDYQLAFLSKNKCLWKCMVGNAKRWKSGEVLIKTVETPMGITQLKVSQHGKSDELFIIEFSWENERLVFAELLHYAGVLPIPPYLNRNTEQSDEERYQTVYAKVEGSVAAPTAGLHFTPQVFDSLSEHEIQRTEVTLHVGAGTFKPVKAEALGEHQMHEETIFVERKVVESIYHSLKQNGPIIAVGTTSMRTLESLYWFGVQLTKGIQNYPLFISQWEAYEPAVQPVSAIQSIEAILQFMDAQQLPVLVGSTQILIAPGYPFQIVEALVTNFHQPESTLILLIAAFIGNDWRTVYDYALTNQFRFLSYGDSSLLWKQHSAQ
jgi:S-adenosylmethionine:tRNA ribosyltransferase-isomerase